MTVMRAHVLDPMLAGHRFEVPPDRQPRRSVAHLGVWTTFAVVAILLMDVLNLTAYGVVIPVAGALLALVMARIGPPKPSIAWTKLVVDRADVIAIAALYVVTVGLFRLAFGVFGTDRVAGLFLSFAAALLIGVAGSVVYTTWIRRRPLASIGIGPQNLRSTLRLGLLLAAVQFSITLWGYDLPEPVDWVPLLIMAITVGLFEAIFFRGFIQGRLEASFGAAPAVRGAAALYALYHVGYGMDAHQMVFLFGLGVVYAIAYRLTENVLVLWPLLIPMGSLYAQLDSGDLVGELPLASIAGFGDVLVVMAIVVWLAHRSERRRRIPRLRPARAGVTAGQRSRAMSLPTDGDIGAGGSSRTTDRTGVSLSGPEGRGGVSGPAFSATPLALPQHADECPSSQSIKRSASIRVLGFPSRSRSRRRGRSRAS
jgi:membrane protease YdiL (CAAX protease family)